MIRLTARLVALAVLVGTAGRAFAADRWDTLQAIHLIENPSNSTRPGPHGELGAYQFRRATWRMHSHKPFHQALNRAESDTVAAAHYDWLAEGLERNGVPATAYNIALAWNAGLSATVSGRAPRTSRDYAQRVVNLARELGGSPLALMTATPHIVLTP